MDKRGTRWQVAALPFGGYVKFLGDANAASGKDEEAMAEAADDPAQLRHTMHGAPLWARAATVAAGPVFNFVLSILVFAAIFMSRGVASDPLTVGELRACRARCSSCKQGDEILGIDGVQTPEFGRSGGLERLYRRAAASAGPGLYRAPRRSGTGSAGALSVPALRVSGVAAQRRDGHRLQAGDVIIAMDGIADLCL